MTAHYIKYFLFFSLSKNLSFTLIFSIHATVNKLVQ